METEIKTLVYRDRAENKTAVQSERLSGAGHSAKQDAARQKKISGSICVNSGAERNCEDILEAPRVGVLQYHEPVAVQKRRVLNKRLAGVAAALFAVIIAGVAILTVKINGTATENINMQETAEDGNAVQAVFEMAENSVVSADDTETGRDEAQDSGKLGESVVSEALNSETKEPGLKTESANEVAVISNVASNIGFEDSIVLMLLSDMAGEQEEDDYIPATMGKREEVSDSDTDNAAGQDDTDMQYEDSIGGIEDDDPSDILAFENTITAESESRLEAVAEVAELLIGPDDVPAGLTYRYNPDMQIEVTDHEIEVLERIVEAEATGMSVYGKMLVANVVINRVNSHYFANDVESVVFQRIGGSYQFSPVKDGRYYSVKVTDTTREAVERVLNGQDYSEGALYFFQRSATSKTKATWFDKNLKFLFKFGAHEFFTEYKK